MKKKLVFAASFILVAWSLTSCEALFQNCKICQTNTYENGTLTDEGEEAEYCGADLLTKEATPDIPIPALNQVIKVECR